VLGGEPYQVDSSMRCRSLPQPDHLRFWLVSLLFRFESSLARDTALDAGSGTERGIASDVPAARVDFENPEGHRDVLDSREHGWSSGLFSLENFGFSGSVLVQVRKHWWTGLSYVICRERLLELALPQGVLDAAPRDGRRYRRRQAELAYQLPQSVSLGLRAPCLPGTSWSAACAGRTTRDTTSSISTVWPRVRETRRARVVSAISWIRDVWRFDVGLEEPEGEALRLGGHVRFETGAVDATEPRPCRWKATTWRSRVGQRFVSPSPSH